MHQLCFKKLLNAFFYRCLTLIDLIRLSSRACFSFSTRFSSEVGSAISYSVLVLLEMLAESGTDSTEIVGWLFTAFDCPKGPKESIPDSFLIRSISSNAFSWIYSVDDKLANIDSNTLRLKGALALRTQLPREQFICSKSKFFDGCETWDCLELISLSKWAKFSKLFMLKFLQ